ncbi:hypothetical protein F5B22DRAFT_619405 [Xylaria bambusicola]|uniref:uncharacterized protein n=1 Tax=Xylaria bambusicola TaxID=326684 RepID=UPI002008A4B9|nr:uncharacterized protein F5B22DRAFT_619405 [Xylaria bambusicola]KAI0508735.1 hypothetical protein F5B22DRAFT_619405 [Xylaria bambusicola]
MHFTQLFLGIGITQAALSAATPIANGSRAVPHGIERRGDEYTMDQLDDLEEAAETAELDQIYEGVDYLVNIWNEQGVEYGLMGGIAMNLYGFKDRETHDSDIVVSVNSRDLLSMVADDVSISRPPPLMAASGVVRLFVNIDDQERAADVFVQGGDQSPPLDTTEVDGYNVLKIAPLISSKLGRGEEKDNNDILWLIDNLSDDVKDAADDIDKQKRIDFAIEYEDDDDTFEKILEAFDLDEDDVEDED